MKTLLLVLPLAATALVGHAADLPEFKSNLPGVPSLSLKDVTQPPGTGGPVPMFGLVEARPTLPRPNTAPRISRENGMPVLRPNPDVDYKLIVKAPDPAVDFKMIVRSPDAASATAAGK